MRRFALGLAWGLLTFWPGLALGDDGPPPFSPPVLSPPVAEPAAEPTKPRDAKPVPDNRPILVIPGVTTPRTGSRPTQGPNLSVTPPSTSAPGVPPLVGPAEMPRGQAWRAAPAATAPALELPPSELDAVPIPRPDRARVSPRPGQPPASGSTGTGAGLSSTVRRPPLDDPADPEPRRPPPQAPRRAPGLFGRLLPPPPVDRITPLQRDRLRDRVVVEPRTDSAAADALRKRVERQIGESFGGRVRSYEVRVVGREVVIHARPTRFWQRRSLRTALESLPMPSGYKATVLVDE